MTHWAEKYVGLPFIDGQFDCADLCRKVYKEVFGKEVAVPNERWYSTARGRQRLREMASQIDAFHHIAEKVDNPKDGDAVLMRVLGRDMHLGIYCVIEGVPWILHVLDKGYSVLHRLSHLEVRGFKVVGYYRPIENA